MRWLFVLMMCAGCASPQKPDPEVLIYWGPDSTEYWEECERVRLCNLEPEACRDPGVEATE